MTEDITIHAKVERLTDGKWLDISTEYETNVAYPLQINDTLDETLDNASFDMISQRKELYPKFSKYKITLTDKQGNTLVRYYYGNDSVQQYTYCKPLYYKHSITLIEPTTMLQRLFVYGKSFTQPTDSSKVNYYIDDMIRILLEVTPLHPVGTPQTYYLDESIAKRLHAVTPVEFSWSNRVTLYEALQDIGYAVGGIPRLIPSKDDDTIWNLITFDFYEDDQGELEDIKYTDYNADLNMDYCASDLVTSAENVTTNIPITVPSNDGWVSVRNETTKVTDESSYIELPSGIEKIEKVEMLIPHYSYNLTIEDYKEWKQHTGVNEGERTVNITDWVVTQGEFDLLPAKAPKSGYKPKGKNNVFYWEHGTNKIANISEVTKSWLGFVTNNTYEKVGEKALFGVDGVYIREKFTGEIMQGRCVSATALDPEKPFKPHFRVTYYPTSNNVMFTTRKTQRGTNQINQIAYNQSAEVVSAEKLGKNARAAAKRVGNSEMKLSTFSFNIADLPKCGQTYQGYKITNVSYQVSDIHKIDVLLELSENYTRASERIAVDRRYRQFAIPQDYVQRKIHRDYYISLDNKKKEECNDSVIDMVRSIFFGSNKRNKNYSNMYIAINGKRLAPNCNQYVYGNSIVFTFTMPTNMVAGRRRYSYEGNAYRNEDIFYCNSDGRVDEVEFGLLADITSGIDSDAYPEITSISGTMAFNNKYKIYKDAGEQLSFEIQIHFVSEDFIIYPNAARYAMQNTAWSTAFKSITDNVKSDMISEKDLKSSSIKIEETKNNCPIVKLIDVPNINRGWAFVDDKGGCIISGKNNENSKNVEIYVSIS